MMNNSHDEIKKLLNASRQMLNPSSIQEGEEIRKKYSLSNDLFICLMVARNNEKTDRKGLRERHNTTSKLTKCSTTSLKSTSKKH